MQELSVGPMARPLIKAIHVPDIAAVRQAAMDELNPVELTLEFYRDGVEWTASVVLTHIRNIEQWCYGGYVFVGTYSDMSTLDTNDSLLFIEERMVCRVSCLAAQPVRVQFTATIEAGIL